MYGSVQEIRITSIGIRPFTNYDHQTLQLMRNLPLMVSVIIFLMKLLWPGASSLNTLSQARCRREGRPEILLFKKLFCNASFFKKILLFRIASTSARTIIYHYNMKPALLGTRSVVNNCSEIKDIIPDCSPLVVATIFLQVVSLTMSWLANHF